MLLSTLGQDVCEFLFVCGTHKLVVSPLSNTKSSALIIVRDIIFVSNVGACSFLYLYSKCCLRSQQGPLRRIWSLGALGEGSGWDLRVCPATPAPASGNLGTWKSGSLEIWEFGDLGAWKSRNLEVWGPGNPEIWGPKNQKNNRSPNPNPFCPKCRQGLD